ncbi:MAG TPA: succinate dehydrogenase assembly factor 2 [Burkholderiales bacterium]|jgi:antitoxin CptB|nr:succinate dehydrogenase assembly factor 2 [Burkholderiales bacterium]
MERVTRDRLQWKCRRGLLELDLVLSQFLKRQVPEMSAADLAAFNELLDYPDTELWDFVSGRSERFDPRFGGVMSRLRTT